MHGILQMMLSTGLELLLSVLLAATLVYCIVLERRLASIRKGQDGLKKMIGELNGAIAGAGASMCALKSAAADARHARLHRYIALRQRASGRVPGDVLRRLGVGCS